MSTALQPQQASVRCVQPHCYVVAGKFTGTTATGVGVTSVTEPGSGVYVLTLDATYTAAPVAVVASIKQGSTVGSSDVIWQVLVTDTSASTITFLVYKLDAGVYTAANLPAATDFVEFIAVFQDPTKYTGLIA